MDGLCAVLAQVPEDPMAPEWIGIQSRGMKQWIATQVTQRFGVCANLSFLYPRQMIELFFTGSGTRQDSLLNEEVLMWSIMETILEHRDTPCFASLENYIAGDLSGRRLFQLSMKIAKIFDNYQVYRPQMLLDWEKTDDNSSFDDPVMAWQSLIWKRVAAAWPHTHVAARMAELIKQAALGRQVADKGPGLPLRISLFGVSAMPPRFLELFGALARTMDIYLFLLTPSDQFFFDIKSLRQMEKMGLAQAGENQTEPNQIKSDQTGLPDPDAGYYEIANPLLAALGRSGREFHGSLEAFDYHEPLGDLFEEPLDRSVNMLAVLQSDVLNLVFRKAGSDNLPLAVDPEDTSICIHACHSPMREAQVLKDLLLEAFEQDPNFHPHEVIVMMPDIEAYAPYLEAVFSCEHSLPFSISDRRKKSESQTLAAFLKILELKDSRLEQTRVLDLLLSPAIAAKFDILPEEFLPIEAKVQESGILWGRDGAHRQELTGAGFDENTWMFGFKRLFMGYGLAEGGEELVAGVLPCDAFEGLEAQILGKIAHFGTTLFECLGDLSASKTIKGWGECFKTLAGSMMERTLPNEADMGFLIQTIDDFIREGKMAGYGRRIDFSVAREIIESKLDKSISQGNFLAGSLTFCNLMPMRSIPFKVVALMGMDEKSFPRKTGAAGFDLIKKYPKTGDKQEREEDQYLFLESLLSARDRLIITYTGMSIKDNSPIPCSGVVEELKDVITQSFEFPPDIVFCFQHPLHPFSPEYFSPGGAFFSFSQDQCKIAMAQAAREKRGNSPEPTPFLPRGFCLDPERELPFEPGVPLGPGSAAPGNTTGSVERSDGQKNAVTLTELVRFFRKPVETFVTRGLNLSFSDIEEPAPDRETFQLSGLSRYGLGSYYMDKTPATDLYPLVRAGGLLPLGQKGRAEWEQVKALADPVLALVNTLDIGEAMPSLGVDTRVGEFQISGRINDFYAGGRVVAGFGKLTPARLLTQWIYHLFFNLQASQGTPCCTRLIGQDPKGKLLAVVYSFGPVTQCQSHIKTLISLYRLGQNQVPAFFCDT
ncbi:MAG: exodeoxyribonuclease V subunit gamma, partial [Deltaproteobacteria bacterium]